MIRPLRSVTLSERMSRHMMPIVAESVFSTSRAAALIEQGRSNMRHLVVRRARRVLAVLHLAVARARRSLPGAARVFSDAPAASWIAPPGVPADSFVVFHARRVVRARRAARAIHRARVCRQPIPPVRQRRAGLVGAAALRRGPLALRDRRSRAKAASRPQRDRGARLELGRRRAPRRAACVAHRLPPSGRRRRGSGAREQWAWVEAARRFRVRPARAGARPDQRLLRLAAWRRDRRRAHAVGMGTARLP